MLGRLFLRKYLTVPTEAAALGVEGEGFSKIKTLLPQALYVEKRTVVEMRRRYAPLPPNLDTSADFFPIALCAGDEDPYVDDGALNLLKDALPDRLTVYNYPRMRHLVCLDKYFDHVKRDLTAFISSH
jgi:alpha-beta hydrolase superfamily lysophospholipase